MDIDILRVKVKHKIQNGRLMVAKIFEFFGFDRLGYYILSPQTREIQDVLAAMSESEKRHLMRAKKKGHVALYRMYRDKYLGEEIE